VRATTGHDSQLLKGVLVLVLLRLLDRRESYGYELVARVHAAGLTAVAEGSIYPAIARLERDGYLVARMVPTQSGPARKYLRPSAAGQRFMHERSQAWRSLVAVLDPLLADHDSALPEVTP
jgi:PadR family transcriptional regulator, regulatory protein PadR